MRKLLNLSFLALTTSLFFSSCKSDTPAVIDEPASAEVTAISGDFYADAALSTVNWKGTKVTGEHSGTINLAEAQITIENNQVVGGSAVIDMATIKVTDLEDLEMNGKLKGHLDSEDFFNVAKYPKAILDIEEAHEGSVHANLTIKETTLPIEFPATVSTNEAGKTVVSGTIVIDRTAYDIKYGSGKFFENLGDKTISDEFELTFSIVVQ